MRLFIMLTVYCIFYLLVFVDGLRHQVTFQLNDLAKQLTGKEIVCSREGQIISLMEATNGTFQSPCFQCICRNRNLICSRKLCPPIPANCPLTMPSLHDECCMECAYCVDERNQRRENGALWSSRTNKCSRYVCETGIKTLSRMECINMCSAEIGIQSQVYCCRLCPTQSVYNTLEISMDPCIKCETVGGFWQQCFRISCPVLNCDPSEQKHSHKYCCPRCVKRRELASPQIGLTKTCQFRHLNYVRGQRFRPDACSQCECTAVGLECRRYVCPVDCPGGHYRPQVCCPFCGHLTNRSKIVPQLSLHSQCVIQLNATKMVWKENDQWSPDACTKCICAQGQVTCQSRVCPEVKCDEQKQKKVTPVGQCCPICVNLKKHQKDDASGLCKLSMDSHLRTFDGFALEVKRPCSFILTQQCLFDGDLPSFVLKMHNNQKGILHKLSIELNEPKNIHLGTLNIIKGKKIKYRGRVIKLPQHTRIFNASLEKNRFNLNLHAIGLKIVWLEGKTVKLHVDRRHFGTLCGLCGNFNRVMQDDLLPRFSMNVTLNNKTFINSWQSEEECHIKKKSDEIEVKKFGICYRRISKKEERRKYSQHCLKLKKSPILSACSTQLPVRKFIRQCAEDVCECERQQKLKKDTKIKAKIDPCYCSSLNAYAEECAKQGLLTFGGSSLTSTNTIKIHAKCPEIKLERVV